MKVYKHPIIPLKTYDDIASILESGQLSGFRATKDYHLGGKWVQKLETEFKAYFGVRHAISMNSATACLHVALIACGIGKDDEVIVTPYSFSASASCALMVGAKPVFCDIEDKTFNMNISKEVAIMTSYKAVVPVHLMGHPCRFTYSLSCAKSVIEDAAQAIGATYNGRYVGTIGDCGVFSFNQSKHISSGEGGMLITNNDSIAEKARALRNHGEVSVNSMQVGYNYRMCEIEACIVYEQFKHLEKNIAHRIELANYLSDKLSGINGLTPPYVAPNCRHVYYTYAVKYNENVIGIPRDVFQKKMAEKGVYFGAGYVMPIHLLPKFGGHEGQMPVAERMWKELCVFDWIRPPYKKADADECIKAIKEVINGNT